MSSLPFPDPLLSLETPRLWLRRFVAGDAPLLRALDDDPEVMRYITGGAPIREDLFREKVMPRFLSDHGEDLGYFAAHERRHGEFIGWFHLRPDNVEHGPQELGYRLRRDVWGRGLATEGARALLKRAVVDGKVQRVSAHCLLGNVASMRVMEKCGLERVRTIVYPAALIPDLDEEARRAYRYEGGRDQIAAAVGDGP